MCGRYFFTGMTADEKLTAIVNMIETHDRMPVIVSEDEIRPYLTDHEAAMEILAVNAPILIRENAAAKES